MRKIQRSDFMAAILADFSSGRGRMEKLKAIDENPRKWAAFRTCWGQVCYVDDR